MAVDSETNHPLGTLVAEVHDDQGPVCVRQLGEHRFLTFGNTTEQSCYNTTHPYRLEHAYTQAMLLAPILSEPAASSLILGLGGGSQVRALRHIHPQHAITAVESRQAVLNIASQWFDIPAQHPAVTLVHEDAEKFLRQEENTAFDSIYLDLYDAEGVDSRQHSERFLTLCREHLSEQGVLAINQWCGDYGESARAREALDAVFGKRTLYLQVPGGNVIVFAFNGALPRLHPKTFVREALKTGAKLDIPLHGHARALLSQNGARLRSRV